MSKSITQESVGRWLDAIVASTSDPEAKAVRKYVADLERSLATASDKLKAFRADSEFLSAAVRSLLFKTFPQNTPSPDTIRMAKTTLVQHDKLVKQQ